MSSTTTNGIAQTHHKTSAKRKPEESLLVSNYNFTVVFTPAEEGGYTVTCPVLPGLVTEGDTLREAREMAREAITGYLEVLMKHGQPLPEKKSRVRTEQIEIKVMAAA
ncbi:MAG: type II toxin-antitoxin system HicB family antitoxin [Acidobacteria bacterium]|nr:type II toxin-antitoxin system HicB family antitoxin [Acidobacteriota bacterium]